MTSQETILVIEDDAAVRRGIVDTLLATGFSVLEAEDGTSGMKLALEATFDLILLDLVLPNHSGFEILEELGRFRPGTPVIILSAKGEEVDRVKGLRLGADDYVVKPFSVRELLARVDAVLRRSAERPGDVREIRFRNGVIDLNRMEIRFANNERTELSAKESELLRYLAARTNRAVSRQELLERVWRLPGRNIETRTIDMHVRNLRAKLRDGDSDEPLIQTVRGKGYMLHR